MARGGVPFVAGEAVLRIARIQLNHPAVSHDLRHDRRRRDRDAQQVAADDGSLGQRAGLEPERVDEEMVGPRRQRPYRADHRQLARFGQPDQVELLGGYRANADRSRAAEHHAIQVGTLLRRQQLRVAHSQQLRWDAISKIRQDNRARDQRPGQRAAPDLVEPGDERKACLLYRQLLASVWKPVPLGPGTAGGDVHLIYAARCVTQTGRLHDYEGAAPRPPRWRSGRLSLMRAALPLSARK